MMKKNRYFLFMLMLIFSISTKGQYNPTNPAEPSVYYSLTLQAEPSAGGSFNIGTITSYTDGTNINLRAYNNPNYTFTGWEQDGKIISSSASFPFTMPNKNVKLIAHFKYEPVNPDDPPEPNLPVYSVLNLTASPSGGGYFNISSGNRYQVGEPVHLTAYRYSNYSFVNWTENGEIISTSNSFDYKMKAGNPTLVAHFSYNPVSPQDPPEPQLYHKLYLNCNPSNGGYFNVSSGNTYQEGSTINLQAYSNQWYTFQNWTLGDSVISSKERFIYVMPEHDVTLTANYSYFYNPDGPREPEDGNNQHNNIYGMTENGVQGQTIHFPIFLENTKSIKGMVVDIQFPQGFKVHTGSVILSNRASGYEMKVKELGNNNFRFSLLGGETFTGDNGKMFEVPVTIPDTATMDYNYPVILTHGVMHATDGSQTPMSVRNGYIYVEKVSEDGLYAKYSYDKLQNRVKFTNLSSGKAVSYLWDFGDGTTSTEKNPLHVYAKSGYYTVKMTAKGEVDTDIAEQTVLINDPSTWRIDGIFYLSDEEYGVRYFSSAERLFQFIGSSSLSGDVKISVLADHSFDYPLSSTNVTLLRKLQSSLANSSYKLSFSKNGAGRNPVLNFGSRNGAIDKNFVDFFITLGKSMSCEGVDLQLWGVSFNPAQIDALRTQTIHSGEKTKEVDFSSVSPDLTYTWSLSTTPSHVSGFVNSGERNIPAMTIVNEGQGNCNLVYNIKGTYGGKLFCEFTNSITVTPALVGLFNSLSPADGFVSDSPTITLTWNSITNAVYDVFLWDAENQHPTTVAEGTTELRYISKNFCQSGHTYKWQIVARNEIQTLVSDTMSFSVRSLPNLHVYALDCSEAVAGKKFTVEWTVKNDGKGSTGDQEWNDYIWLVPDIYAGTHFQNGIDSQESCQLIATVKNVKVLGGGESYHNSIDLTLDERTFGNYYLLVTADMYNVSNIEWNAVGGSVINPYNPTQNGTGYRHLYATTSASNNKVYEQGETSTRSDNFFYKKIEIADPSIADLQVPVITAEVMPAQDPCLAAGARKMIKGDCGYVYDENYDLIYSWETDYIPTPLTAAGLRYSNSWYSGKVVAVTVTIANKGGEDTKEDFNTVLYMSSSPDRNASPLTAIASKTCKKKIKPGESTTLTYAVRLPYEWFGDIYFHAYADIDDNVFELANTQNNWGKSEKYNVMLCPGADFVPSDLNVPASLSTSTPFTVSYKVKNQGSGIPYSRSWKDKLYLSKKNTGIDESAMLLSTITQSAGFDPVMIASVDGFVPGSVIIRPESFHYSKDNYSKNETVSPQANIPTGTYYLYLKVDADDAVYEHEGEDNNVLMFGPISYTFTQADVEVELVSISADTLKTGAEVALTWKLKNAGNADIKDAKITDAFYATVNQTATGGTFLGKVENTVWIAAGSEKTIRANLTIPKNSSLDGLRYIYVKTNFDNQLVEASTANNTSEVIRSWCKYVAEPSVVVPTVRGTNLYVSDLMVNHDINPGESVIVSYIAHNNGDMDLPKIDVTQEVFLSDSYTFDVNKATKCEIVKQTGTVSGLKTNRAANLSLTFRVPNIYGGKKYLHIFVDKANVLGEKNVSDNHVLSEVIIRGNLPDLVVVDSSFPDTIMTSIETQLPFTVNNQGEWDANKSTTNIYLSSDSKFDRNDLQLASLTQNPLVKGASSGQRATVTIADKKVGNWYLLIRADAHDQIVEMDEDNNVMAIPVTVIPSPLPDLAVFSILTDSVLTCGQPVRIRTTMGNVGKAQTRSNKWSDTYYLSNGTILNPKTAIQLGSKAHVGTLSVGADYKSEVTFTLPSNVQGNFMLFAATDAADAIAEEDENNNAKGIPVFINGSADMPADLVIAGVTAPGSIKAGENVTITYQIQNKGEYAAAADVHDVIYLSKDNKWDLDDEMVGVVSGNASIDPGQTLTRRVTGRVVNMPEGDYFVIVKTNSTHSVAELDFDNNVGVMKSSTRLSFNTIALDGDASLSTSGYYKLNVPNGYEGKTVGLYLQHPAEAMAGLYAAYEEVPSTANFLLSSSALEETQQEILIPNVQAGNYYILAQDNAALVNGIGNVFTLDGSSQQTTSTPMTLSAKDIQFGATTLSIKEGGNDGWVTTQVNGALFDSIMDFRLKLDQTVIPAEVVTYNGMTKSFVTFNLNDAKVGSYDVVSELPNGTLATLSNGFKVIPGVSSNLGVKIDAPHWTRIESYVPISISYANGGNTDIVIRELLFVVDGGSVATTIEGLDKAETILHLKPEGNIDGNGYIIIPPGTHKTINCFFKQYVAGVCYLKLYIVK